MQYDTHRYNLTPNMDWSPYVGKGPEVDEAWEQISRGKFPPHPTPNPSHTQINHPTNPTFTTVGDMSITLEEVNRLQLSPDSLKITDPKTGKVGYRAAIEVFHQLHCLNLLRQFSYKEYYATDGGDIDAPAADVRGHVGESLLSLHLHPLLSRRVMIVCGFHFEANVGGRQTTASRRCA